MGEVIGKSERQKLAKGLRYPIQYSDLEACFVGKSEQNIYLVVDFTLSLGSKKWRDKQTDEGLYRLLSVVYPKKSLVGNSAPWKDEENPIVLEAKINSIPTVSMKANYLTREIIAKLLLEHIPLLFKKEFDRWEYTMTLHALEEELHCISKTWQGIKENDAVTTIIPLAIPQ